MKPSNKAIRNAWASLAIVGIAAFAAGVWSIAIYPDDRKSWIYFFAGFGCACLFIKKLIIYQKLVNKGIEYGS